MSIRSPRQSDHDPIAAEERSRVIAAARALLAEEQVALGFSIDTLAARAGVARAQVQRRFGTPAGVLEALWDQLFSDGCLALLPPAFALTEPTAVLAELIAIHGRFWDRERRVIRRLKAFAALDSGLERALLVRERQRREGLRKLVERFPRRSVPAGSEPELERMALFALVTAFELFDTLAGPDRPIADVIPAVQMLASRALAPS